MITRKIKMHNFIENATPNEIKKFKKLLKKINQYGGQQVVVRVKRKGINEPNTTLIVSAPPVADDGPVYTIGRKEYSVRSLPAGSNANLGIEITIDHVKNILPLVDPVVLNDIVAIAQALITDRTSKKKLTESMSTALRRADRIMGRPNSLGNRDMMSRFDRFKKTIRQFNQELKKFQLVKGINEAINLAHSYIVSITMFRELENTIPDNTESSSIASALSTGNAPIASALSTGNAPIASALSTGNASSTASSFDSSFDPALGLVITEDAVEKMLPPMDEEVFDEVMEAANEFFRKPVLYAGYLAKWMRDHSDTVERIMKEASFKDDLGARNIYTQFKAAKVKYDNMLGKFKNMNQPYITVSEEEAIRMAYSYIVSKDIFDTLQDYQNRWQEQLTISPSLNASSLASSTSNSSIASALGLVITPEEVVEMFPSIAPVVVKEIVEDANKYLSMPLFYNDALANWMKATSTAVERIMLLSSLKDDTIAQDIYTQFKDAAVIYDDMLDKFEETVGKKEAINMAYSYIQSNMIFHLLQHHQPSTEGPIASALSTGNAPIASALSTGNAPIASALSTGNAPIASASSTGNAPALGSEDPITRGDIRHLVDKRNSHMVNGIMTKLTKIFNEQTGRNQIYDNHMQRALKEKLEIVEIMKFLKKSYPNFEHELKMGNTYKDMLKAKDKYMLRYDNAIKKFKDHDDNDTIIKLLYYGQLASKSTQKLLKFLERLNTRLDAKKTMNMRIINLSKKFPPGKQKKEYLAKLKKLQLLAETSFYTYQFRTNNKKAQVDLIKAMNELRKFTETSNMYNTQINKGKKNQGVYVTNPLKNI